MKKVLFATGNEGKINEMRPLFEARGLELAQVGVDVAELDDMDVGVVAKQKVLDSYEDSDEEGMMIVEDTGFFVEAIGGFPGVEAAYFDRTAGADKLLDLMESEDERRAYFETAIAVLHEGEVTVFKGRMDGEVPREKRGESHPHLPYNSYFVPEQGEESLAENPELKDENFHRNKAVRKFLDWLDTQREEGTL